MQRPHRLCHPLIQLHRILTQKIRQRVMIGLLPGQHPQASQIRLAPLRQLPRRIHSLPNRPDPQRPQHTRVQRTTTRGRPARADAVLIGRPVQPAHRQPDPPNQMVRRQHIFRIQHRHQRNAPLTRSAQPRRPLIITRFVFHVLLLFAECLVIPDIIREIVSQALLRRHVARKLTPSCRPLLRRHVARKLTPRAVSPEAARRRMTTPAHVKELSNCGEKSRWR